jgi:hypothetical protein
VRTLIEPEEQCVHSLRPARAATLPASQSVHALEPALDMDPAPQSIQLVAPGRVDALPASQFVHAMLAIWSEYVPLVQRVQDPWPVAAWDRPAAHFVQLVDPEFGALCPASHGRQVDDPASAPKKPGTHRVQLASPLPLNHPAGHCEHCELPALLTRPAGQFWQTRLSAVLAFILIR